MIDLIELKKLCDDYDDEFGSFPEADFQGRAVFDFIKSCVINDQEPNKPSSD